MSATTGKHQNADPASSGAAPRLVSDSFSAYLAATGGVAPMGGATLVFLRPWPGAAGGEIWQQLKLGDLVSLMCAKAQPYEHAAEKLEAAVKTGDAANEHLRLQMFRFEIKGGVIIEDDMVGAVLSPGLVNPSSQYSVSHIAYCLSTAPGARKLYPGPHLRLELTAHWSARDLSRT